MKGDVAGGDLPGGNPLSRRRALGTELRRFRLDRELTAERAAIAIGRSASWISRLESGKIGIRPRDLRDLLDVYGVTGRQRREGLESLAVEGRHRTWWSSYRDVVGESYSVFIGLEDSARSVFEYQERVVPGLLQTVPYMRALYSRNIRLDSPVRSREDMDRLVEVRHKRQEILLRPDPPAVTAVIDESIVHRTVGGPEVHRGQLMRLLDLGASGVDLRILSFGESGGPPRVPSFTLLEPVRGEAVVYVESIDQGAILDVASAVRYGTVVDQLREVAMSSERSLDFIATVLKSITVET